MLWLYSHYLAQAFRAIMLDIFRVFPTFLAETRESQCSPFSDAKIKEKNANTRNTEPGHVKNNIY